MFKRLFLFTSIITLLFSMNCNQLFALSPKASLDNKLISLAYTHINSIIKVINNDELLILGEIYKVNNLILDNFQHIDIATEDDVPRIVELFARIRKQDSWGFDPGNSQAEEEYFLKLVQNIPIVSSRIKVTSTKIFDLKKENEIMQINPRTSFKEKSTSHYILVYRDQYQRVQGYINLEYIKQGTRIDLKVSEIVVDKANEGMQIARSLYFYALQKIEETYKNTITKYNITGTSDNEKIYGKRGLTTKTGFQKLSTGFDIQLQKEINFSPFQAIQTLQSI